MEVTIQGKNGIEMAIRVFRKKTQKEGLVKESRRRNEFEKPSKKIKATAISKITDLSLWLTFIIKEFGLFLLSNQSV